MSRAEQDVADDLILMEHGQLDQDQVAFAQSRVRVPVIVIGHSGRR
jgi:hypothetical protein